MYVLPLTVECYEEHDSMRTSDVDPSDYKYIVETPDASFSPQRNKAIIEETIADTIKFNQKLAELDEDARDRIDIVNAYGRYRFNRGDMKFKDYAGKQLYTRLVGEKILDKVKNMTLVDKLAGKKQLI